MRVKIVPRPWTWYLQHLRWSVVCKYVQVAGSKMNIFLFVKMTMRGLRPHEGAECSQEEISIQSASPWCLLHSCCRPAIISSSSSKIDIWNVLLNLIPNARYASDMNLIFNEKLWTLMMRFACNRFKSRVGCGCWESSCISPVESVHDEKSLRALLI